MELIPKIECDGEDTSHYRDIPDGYRASDLQASAGVFIEGEGEIVGSVGRLPAILDIALIGEGGSDRGCERA